MTDIQKQINLLESQDSRVSDDARQALSLQIGLGNGIYQVVHYYGKTHSNRALDLLCKIKEPHDKTFLDSLSDSIKEKKIMATLDLLGQIVQTAPSWTPKIALHPIFKAILQYSVNTRELDECIGVLLFAAALLPHCSSFPQDVLNALFHAFIEGCQTYRIKWLTLDSRRSTDCWERADVAHIAFALREFFHAIYGIYPTNFISYLRNHFVDKNGTTRSRDVATYVICPLLAGVRLHPNLILVGKDKELSKDRWHQRESHDFLDDSRRVIIGKIPINAINGDLHVKDLSSTTGILLAMRSFKLIRKGSQRKESIASQVKPDVPTVLRPVLRPYLSYAWVAAGYVDVYQGPFSTPTDYAFNEEEVVIPCQGEDCSSLAFLLTKREEQGLFYFQRNGMVQIRIVEKLAHVKAQMHSLDGFDICSEPESPPPAPVDSFHLFPSIVSQDAGGDHSDDSENFLLNALNTPPSSNIDLSPQKRNAVDEEWSPLVITSDERHRRTVEGGGSFSSLRNSIGSFFRRDKGNEVSSRASPLNWVVEYGPDSSCVSEMSEQTEEAEEAMDCLTPTAEITSATQETRDSSSKASLSGETSVATATRPTTLDKQSSSTDSQHDLRNDGFRIAQAAQAAVCAVRREHYLGYLDSDDAVGRSRSASFLFDTPYVDDPEKHNIQSSEKLGSSNDRERRDSDNTANNENGECTRNRFSIGSFFSKLNRQRFASECHNMVPCAKPRPTRQSQEAMSSLIRVSSCPDVLSETRTPAGLARAEINAKVHQENLLERFPYLKLIQPLGSEHYVEIEANLQCDHERRRTAYMERSKSFHQCLKELGLADRLPGRIYDDMTHITDGLPMERQVLANISASSDANQGLIAVVSLNDENECNGRFSTVKVLERDVLRARLALVNQHLLYERSCRLLHANRNRRLFGRIKLQKVTDAELEQLKENLHVLNGERKELISALSSLRRSINLEKRNRVTTESELLDKVKDSEAQCYRLSESVQEVSSQKEYADREAKRWRSQVDQYRRRIDDAEEQARLLQLQLFPMESKIQDLRKAQLVNQQLRDQIHLLESRYEDERYLRFGQGNERSRRRQDLENLQKELIAERSISEEHRIRAQEWEQMCKAESMRSAELKGLLDRATNLLREQKDAAEQKFLSLQAVVRKQEEHILDLYRRAEERDDFLRRLRNGGVQSTEYLPVTRVPSEIKSFDSSLSDVYIPRDVLYGASPNEPRSSEEEVVLDLEEAV